MSFNVADPIYYNKPVFRFRKRPMATKKNLFHLFEDEDSVGPSEDAIKVFLRLKPTVGESDVIQLLDSRTLLFKMPAEFMQARNKLNMPDQYKYSFSHIYQPDTTQSQIYTGCVAPLIKDLFNGQHCLLFTYGTTNAGKTFTVLGNGDNPGIIPRTLTTVFKSISGKEYVNDQIMPDKFNSALEVTEQTLLKERSFKEGIMMWNHNKSQPDSKLQKTQNTVCSSEEEIFGESVYREMQKRLTNDTSIIEYTSDTDDRFSVWVSFAEVYNEAIYDLLQPVIPNSKRSQLKLGQDNHKNYYIKGLKHVFVQSEEEAYKVLMFGKTNLQVAATGMNSRSSRSHCIFTIKLIKSPNVESPERVVVSSFSICDLAGAERQKKTLNVGLRLKESQNINCSLHVLSRCFNIIRENQLSLEPKMVPFRDSKLTQLFKHALMGKETVTMIVNVNPEHKLCEETQHVLKASAIAKHIVVMPRKTNRPQQDLRKSRFSQIIVKHNRSTLIPWDSCVKPKALEAPAEVEEAKTVREQKQEQYENVLSLVEELKEKLKAEKAKHLETKKNWRAKEEEIRKDMREEYTKLFEKAKKQDEFDRKRAEDVMQELGNNKKRKLLTADERSELEEYKTAQEETWYNKSHELKDLQDEVKMQQKEIDGLTDLVNILRDEKKELRMDLSLAQVKLSHKERDITNLKAKIEMFGEESTLHEKYLALEKEMEGKILARDELLNEAKEDMLAEMRAKDELEDEITKLEQELNKKEEDMLNQIEELKEEVNDKEDTIELLEARIENMEYVHADAIQQLKAKCATFEEQIILLSQKEEKSLSSNIEELLCEKVSLEEQLANALKEHAKLKQETAEKFNSLTKEHGDEMSKITRDFNEKLLVSEELVRQNEELNVKLQSLESINEELRCRIGEADLYKSKLEKMKKEDVLEKTDLENRIIQLTQRLKEEETSSAIVADLKSKCQSLEEALEKVYEDYNTLKKTVESLSKDKKVVVEEYDSEINALQQDLKKQLQETTRLCESQREKEKENEKLAKELNKVKKVVADLNSSLKTKEHELECCQSKMMGYEKMVPTLKSEFEVQRSELLDYKKRCEDYVETIINMEKEQNSFQVNQKEIIGKYEDNLKKSKEENESLKKEVARVTTTFYKSTPTPKKVLEKQIEEQRTLLEDLKTQLNERETYCQKLQNENATLFKNLQEIKKSIADGSNKENESLYYCFKCNSKGAIPRRQTTKQVQYLDIRHGAQSCEDDPGSSSDMDNKRAKSASKAKTRRTTRATTSVRQRCLPTISIIDTDESNTSENKHKETKKQSCRKLFGLTSNDDEQFEDDEETLNIPQDSPRSFYRRTLRNRNGKK